MSHHEAYSLVPQQHLHTHVVDPPEVEPPLSPYYLGNFKVVRCLGRRWLVSPDWSSWFAPTTVSLILGIGGWLLARDLMSWLDHLIFVADVIAAFTFSLLCGLEDPGIYPRLADGVPDPLAHEPLALCRVCKLKRPLRSSHCYTCGVCVLEHDHHCGIVGGCIGQRTLRYFVAYLVCISSSCVLMFWHVLRSIMRIPGGMGTAYKTAEERRAHAGDSFQFALHIVALMAIGNIALVVGIMAIDSVGLLATDTTRREAQGKKSRGESKQRGGCCGWIDNCKRAIYPPSSILVWGEKRVRKPETIV
jgi:hypothetical protein